MDFITFLIRIAVCFFLGVAIGFERQWRRKAIGLRTNTLVCLGAFLFVAMSCLVQDSDKTRVAAQVVSGIGFLGAGVILRDGMNVRGLNTAATLWCSAAIGTMTAFGLIKEAVLGTVLILFSNIFLRFLSKKIMQLQKKSKKVLYSLEIDCMKNNEFSVKNLLIKKIETYHLILKNMTSKTEENKVSIHIVVENTTNTVRTIEKLVNRISVEPGILFMNWEVVEIDQIELDDDDNC